MKRLLTLAVVALLGWSSSASADDEGMIKAKSSYSAVESMDRLERKATEEGLKIFARIDHAKGAACVDMKLRPTEVLVFGNPKGGTPLMLCAQTVGIDLPLKALVWQDAKGQVWLGYNDPEYLVRRHGAKDCAAAKTVGQALKGLVKTTLARPEGG